MDTLTPERTCSSCGRAFAQEDLAVFGEHSVCAACQPAFVQSYRQGMVDAVAAPKEFHYAGFWIRVCAEVIDTLILMAFQLALFAVAGLMLGAALPRSV